MRRLFLCCLLWSGGALALSPEAKEFLEIARKLEPVQCEKRKLRREIALAEIEKRDASELKRRFSRLDRDPETARLEKRLAELEPRILDRKGAPRRPEDLEAISRQSREAFYRCE